MSKAKDGLRVGVAGLGFGAEFVPIYLHHPDVSSVSVCDSDPKALERARDRYGVTHAVRDLDELLRADIDAVHLVTPIPLHAKHAVRVLEAGRHCACTVPMATSLEDILRIQSARRRSGKCYMMMETALFTREFLQVRSMVESGEIGRIQFLRGAHYQDMERWPAYWRGLPPMHYATHAIAPLLAIADARAVEVRCLGSGWMREELVAAYGNPYPVETAQFRLERLRREPVRRDPDERRDDLAAEVTRTLFHTAREYTESFSVYGDRASFEWQQIEDELPVVFRFESGSLETGESARGRSISRTRIEAPDVLDDLPPEIRRFTRRGVYDESNPHRSFLQGGGHGGSHPHLVNEFVRAIMENRLPAVDDVVAARITGAGIAAHDSAMAGGALVAVPEFADVSGC